MAALLVSCVKEELKNTTPDTVHMTIVAGADDETRTVLGENGQVNWSLSGEKLAVWQNGTYAKSEDGVTTDNGATMKFGVILPSGTAPYSYCAIYPNMAAYKPDDKSASVSAAKIDLRQAQYPTAQSFGPSSDILVAKPVTGLSERPAELSLQFARMVAIGKMQIKNLNSTENVTRVTFKADGKKIAGRNAMDLTKDITVAEVSGEINPAQDNIALAYNGENIAANGMTAYFTCWPFSMATGETFTVEVYTPGKYFTRTVTLPRDLEFKQGRAASFGVDFSGIEGVERQHFTYAKLTADDYAAAGAKAEYSLTTVKPNGPDGPIWDCLAYKNTDEIQVRKYEDVNDSYIKLPTFKDDIRKVRVVLKSASNSGTVCLETSASGTTKNITNPASETDFTFEQQLEGKGMKTAYLRVTGQALHVSSIEVWAGEDTRTQLAAPSNIKAALVDGTPNSIKVTWNAVENAGSYVVTATPATGDAVSETVTEPSHTFTNLAYETEYTISVVAKPADAAAYKDSEAGVCADKVKTSANTSTSHTVTYTVASTTSVTTSGEAPAGSSVTFKNTYSTKEQMTKNNSQTYTLKGYAGNTIKGVVLNMKSNGSAGSGTFSMTAGTTKLAEIASATGFNQWYDNTSYGTSYRNVNVSLLSDSYMIQDGEDVVIKIAATVNSLYCSSISIEYDTTPDTREPLATPENLTCSAQTENSLTFIWDEVANASGYQVSLDGGSNWETTQTETTYTWEGLSAGTTYTLYVKAIGDGTTYKDSDAVSAEGKTTGESQGGEEKSEVITLSGGVYSGSGTTGTIVWSGISCSIAQTKENSQTNVSSSYVANPRWYASHKIAFTAKTGYTLTKVVVECTSSSYANVLKTSTYSNSATPSISGTKVEITTKNGDFDVTMGAQSRISSITVYYTE